MATLNAETKDWASILKKAGEAIVERRKQEERARTAELVNSVDDAEAEERNARALGKKRVRWEEEGELSEDKEEALSEEVRISLRGRGERRS